MKTKSLLNKMKTKCGHLKRVVLQPRKGFTHEPETIASIKKKAICKIDGN